MKIGNQKELDKAMYKWYVQQKAWYIKVTSESKHGLSDLQVRDEAGGVDTPAAEVYRVQLNELIEKEGPKDIMPMKLAILALYA